MQKKLTLYLNNASLLTEEQHDKSELFAIPRYLSEDNTTELLKMTLDILSLEIYIQIILNTMPI